MANPNHSSKKAIKRPDDSLEVSSFEGLMPDPQTLREMEELVPGCSKVWMDLAASEIKSRQKNEGRITWTFRNGTIIGQVLGFITSIAVLGVGCYAISRGDSTDGAVIITGSAATVIAAYLFKSRKR